MIGSYGLIDYGKLFSSPVSQYQNNPVSNLIYGSAASKVYSQAVAKKIKSDMSSYLSSMNGLAGNVKSASKPFTSVTESNTFNRKSVASSEPSAASGTASPTADKSAYSLRVSRLALSQESSGIKLASDSKSLFSTGMNTFSIKVGEITKNISFSIDESDTNKSGLQKMAASLNFAKTGVTASVISDSKTGTSFLQLKADKTGTKNAFTVMDVRGSAISQSGANTITVGAQDAGYTLNGKEYTSQSNTISVNNGKVKFTLLKADNKEIKLDVKQDAEGIVSDIEQMATSYNNMIKLANSYSYTFNGAEKLKEELSNIVKVQKSALIHIGIAQDSSGILSIDKDKLKSSIEKNAGYVKDVLSGKDGFAQKLYSKANEVLGLPAKYAKPQDMSYTTQTSNMDSNLMAFSNKYQSRTNLYLGLVMDMML